MQENSEKLTISEFAVRAGCSPQRVSQLLRKSLKQFQVIENGRKYILSDGLQVVLDAREKQGYRKNYETVSSQSETVSETLSNSFETVSNNEKITELTEELGETRAALDSVRPQVAAQAIELESIKKELEKTVNELRRTRADLEAARDQRDKAEIRAAAADAESKRADTAEAQLSVKDQQIQQQSDRIGDLTAALRAAQDQNKELTTALTAAQALNAGTMQMLMEKATPETVTASQREDVPESIPTPQQEPLISPQDAAAPSESEPQQRKPRLFARLFRKKEKM